MSSHLQHYLSLVGDSADVTAPNFWLNRDFYTTLNSKATRNIFTTLFVVLNLLLGVLGVLLLKRRNQLQLLRGRDQVVPLNRLSSWMSATDTAFYTWQTRRLPGGIFGLFMLITGVFGIVHQFFVSSFITSAPGLFGSCAFTTGLVIRPPFVGTGPNGTLLTAGSQWPAALVAINSQVAAIRHGDPPGIYAKANSNTNFTVAKDNPDYLGNWNCEELKHPTTVSSNASIQQIGDTLETQGSIYHNWYSEHRKLANGVLIWSSSVADNVRQPWGVKASVGPDAADGQPMIMYNYNCSMVAPAVEWVLANISSGAFLQGWAESAYGQLILGSDKLPAGNPDTYAATLEVILNAMVMATASQDNATSLVTSDFKSHYDSKDTFRCAAERTIIAQPIWVVLGFLLLHLLGFLLADIILVLLIYCCSEHRAVSDIPSDLPSWQLATLRDRFPQEPVIEAKRMHEYVYGWCPNHKRLQFKEKLGPQVRYSSQDGRSFHC